MISTAIDGDVLVYRTGFAGQQSLFSAVLPDGTHKVQDAPNKTELSASMLSLGYAPEEYNVHKEIVLDNPSHVAHSLDVQLDSIISATNADQFHALLTGSGNYRSVIAKTAPYKGNRVQEKPAYYDFIRTRLERKYRAEVIQGAEADDAVAILGAKGWVMASIDKDLDQVPGMHWNWVKQSMYEISEHEGAHWLFCQALSGDSTDNIPGIHRLGLKGADKYIIKENCTTWDDYVRACIARYEVAGLTEDAFQEMFSLVYLCRTDEDLVHAKQTASERGTGVPASTVAAAAQYMSSLRQQD